MFDRFNYFTQHGSGPRRNRELFKILTAKSRGFKSNHSPFRELEVFEKELLFIFGFCSNFSCPADFPPEHTSLLTGYPPPNETGSGPRHNPTCFPSISVFFPSSQINKSTTYTYDREGSRAQGDGFFSLRFSWLAVSEIRRADPPPKIR